MKFLCFGTKERINLSVWGINFAQQPVDICRLEYRCRIRLKAIDLTFKKTLHVKVGFRLLLKLMNIAI